MTFRAVLIAPLMLLICCAAPVAMSTPITLVLEANGVGTLGGTAFAGDFAITARGDTDDYVGPFALLRDSTIAISGLPPVELTPPSFSLWRTSPLDGFNAGLFPAFIINVMNDPVLDAWDLRSPLSPVTAEATLLFPDTVGEVATTGGDFILTSILPTVRIGATVPVPSTAVLMALALFGCGIWRRQHSPN